MTTISIPIQGRPRIQGKRYARNGKYPDAKLWTELALQANQTARYRVKELASFAQPIENIVRDGDASLVNWRFACHTSPYAGAVWAIIWMAQGASDSPNTPYCRVRLETVTPTTVGDAEFAFGSFVGTPVDVPSNFGRGFAQLKVGKHPADIPVSTDLYGTITGLNDAAIVAVAVYEVGLAPDTDNGYIGGGYAATTPILDVDRLTPTTIARDVWRHGAGPLWNWSVDTDDNAITNSTTTAKNVIDNSSTSVSAATPGVTLDLTNCSTVRRASSGVPVAFKVYASRATSDGTVTLKDSGGSTVLSVSVTGAAGWYSTTGFLPATEAKYDLHYVAGAAGTITLFAASLYQYEADP